MEKNTKVIIVMFILIASLLIFMYIISKPKENNENIEIFNVSNGFFQAKGNLNSKIIMIEFSDFQCPLCKSALLVIDEVLNKYDVAFYYRTFPLEMHENSFEAALAAFCADEQGKFWEYHDVLFANQNRLDKESLKKYASELELNTNLFNECLDSEKYKGDIQKDINDGKSAGVQGTPTFFVNGRKVEGADRSLIEKIIDEEIAEI